MGIRINGDRSTGNVIEGNTLDANQTGIQLYGGATATEIKGALVTNSEKIGIAVDAPASQIVDSDVTGGLIGIDLRSPASIERGIVAQVDVGVAVRSPEAVSIKGITINALEIGVRVDRLSTAFLSNSTVSAPLPYKGSEQIDVQESMFLSRDGRHRMRTWHWFKRGAPFKKTLVQERRP